MQVELKKNTAFTWGKWGEKNAPWGVQCENRKNTSATQKHIHDITTGEVNPAQQAAIWSRSHWYGAGQTRLTRPADRSEQRRMVGGGGTMSVMSVGWGRNARVSHCIAHPWVLLSLLKKVYLSVKVFWNGYRNTKKKYIYIYIYTRTHTHTHKNYKI